MKTSVFYMLFPEKIGEKPLGNAGRNEEVLAAKNARVACERYFSFALLDAALAYLGLPDSKNAYRSESGRWEGLTVDFSISHSDNTVAVALSDRPVGVDIQCDTGLRISDALLDRALTDDEKKTLSTLPESEKREAFLRMWSAKESLFKRENKAFFHPREYDSRSADVKTLRLDNGRLTVASDDGEIALFFAETQEENIKIIKSERKFSE